MRKADFQHHARPWIYSFFSLQIGRFISFQHKLAFTKVKRGQKMTDGNDLPAGARLRRLEMHSDGRGCFTEIFRNNWSDGTLPMQWNAVSSRAGVLRGVHVHAGHDDLLVVVQGRAIIGLHDIRTTSPTFGLARTVKMCGAAQSSLFVPRGVAHGFYFPEDSLMVYAVSAYWDLGDEIGCHWADRDLKIAWGIDHAITSPRDSTAGSFEDMCRSFGGKNHATPGA